MSVNFPNSPSLDQTYTAGDRTWRWNGRFWQAVSTTIGYTGSRGADGTIGVDGYTGSVGFTGSRGDTGLGFRIAKSYASVAALEADTSPTGIIAGEFAVIETGDVDDPENSRLYLWSGSAYTYVTDLSGAAGLTGPDGAIGFTGSQGDTGFVGSQGDLGYTGSIGFTGSQGESGTIGVDGYTGSIGYTGSQGESSFTWGPTAPVSPTVGDRWYDTGQGVLTVYVDDGDSQQWVEVYASGFLGQTGYTGSGAYPSLANNQGTALINDGNNVYWSEGTMMFRNRIINGDMRIDQRRSGAETTTPTTNSVVHNSVDRWAYVVAAASKITLQQNAGSVTPPPGFKNYLGITSTSNYTPGATETFTIYQFIEGYNIEDFDYGTAQAATSTLSFWVRSSQTGTLGGVIRSWSTSPQKYYTFSYTISQADTWEYKTVTISGDTVTASGSTTTGIGLVVGFSMGAGSESRQSPGTWTEETKVAPTDMDVDIVATSGATLYLTGVQLEKGSVATRFERRPLDIERRFCMRYYETGQMFVQSGSTSAFTMGCSTSYLVEKRATPTVTLSTANSGGMSTGAGLQNSSTKSVGFNANFSGSGAYAFVIFTSNAEF